MRTFKPTSRRLARIGLALAALVAVAAVSGPAAADYRYGHHSNGFFSFGFGSPGYYYAPPPAYYYPPPPPVYYYPPPPPPAYYYPPPAYYGPSASFNVVVPFGHHH